LSFGKVAGRLRVWLLNNVACKPRHRGCILQKTVLADAVFCAIQFDGYMWVRIEVSTFLILFCLRKSIRYFSYTVHTVYA